MAEGIPASCAIRIEALALARWYIERGGFSCDGQGVVEFAQFFEDYIIGRKSDGQ